MFLTLKARGRNTFHEITLAQEEDDNHGNRHDHAGRQDDFPLHLSPLPELVQQSFEAARQREEIVVVQIDDGLSRSVQLALNSKTNTTISAFRDNGRATCRQIPKYSFSDN